GLAGHLRDAVDAGRGLANDLVGDHHSLPSRPERRRSRTGGDGRRARPRIGRVAPGIVALACERCGRVSRRRAVWYGAGEIWPGRTAWLDFGRSCSPRWGWSA